MALTKISRGLLSTGISDSSDATAITIDSSENVLVGSGTSNGISGSTTGLQVAGAGFAGMISATRHDNNAYSSNLMLGKSRNTTVGSNTIVQSGDEIGAIGFFADDGTNLDSQVAYIRASVDGTPGENDTPGRLTFSTTADGSAAATERMRIDASGNVGIGVTSPSGKFHVAGSPPATNGGLVFVRNSDAASNNTSFGGIHFSSSPGTDFSIGKANVNGATSLSFRNGNTGASYMDIASNGQVCFNSTIIATNSASCGFNPHSNQGAELFFTRPSSFSGTGNPILNYHGGTYIGGINTSTSATSFLTSSDYRLKENVNYEFDALSRIAQLKPARFNFIIEKNKTVDGFLAHEVSDIVPEAVTGEKDGEQIQGIDQSKLVPLLTKAIQEQQTQIEALQAEINTLKGE